MVKNKTEIRLSSIVNNTGNSFQDSAIINERVSDFRAENRNFEHSIFEGVGIRNKKLKLRSDNQLPDIDGCTFSHSIFRNCYFRNVRFRNCEFINCRFIDCNFPESTFVVCDLSYAQFQNTHIDPGNILSNLPPYENLKVSLLRSIRMNYSNLGEGDHSRQCFLFEMEASAEHYWKVAFDKQSYYREKYDWWMRIKAFFTWGQAKFEHLFWGYGESPIKLALWTAVLISIFSVAYLDVSTSYIDALRISAFAFATVGYGDHLSAKTHGIDWILLESLIGVVFVGLLAASFFKWISRRQR